MKRTYWLLFAAALAFSGCEKDDICDGSTPTTPRLVIEFYDISNPAILKNVTSLKVIGAGMTEGVVFDEVAGTEISNGNKILIPLKTTEDNTQYRFVLNSDNANPALVLTDTIDFNYSRNEIYVSRACGFKTLFDLNLPTDPLRPVVINNGQPGSWVKAIEIPESDIQTENETHVKIFF